MANIKLLEDLSNAFGPSGFEEDVCKVIAAHCSNEFDLKADAMNNVYAHLGEKDLSKPTIMLDAHLDEVGFIVQAIQANGFLSIISLGSIFPTNIPAHSVIIKTESGKLVKGITSSKPPHFMTIEEKKNITLDEQQLYIDVGASSREEVINDFGVHVGDPVMLDVQFSYDNEHDLCIGKAFDNRLGCLSIIETMRYLKECNNLPVNVVGAFAAQEEVGTRGATVTSRVVAPDLAIVFEGSPSDDMYFDVGVAQGSLRKGTQIRHMDVSYISNPRFIKYAHIIGDKHNIKYQGAVRRGGGTNAGKISLSNNAVPVLVLGIPTRYIHSHYNFCTSEDIDSTVKMATEVIKGLTPEIIAEICGKNTI